MHLRTVIEFISTRHRKWTFIAFAGTRSSRCKAKDFLNTAFNLIPDEYKQYFESYTVLYYKQGLFSKIFSKLGFCRNISFYENLHTFIKETKGDDQRFI